MIPQLLTTALLTGGLLLAAAPAHAGETAITSSNTLPVNVCAGAVACVSTDVYWSVDEHVVHPPYNFCGTQYLVYGDDATVGTTPTSFTVLGIGGNVAGVEEDAHVRDVFVQTPC